MRGTALTTVLLATLFAAVLCQSPWENDAVMRSARIGLPEGWCDAICTLPMPPEIGPVGGQRACGQNLKTYYNNFCPNSLWMSFYCESSSGLMGMMYAGDCGCPNDCMEPFGQGHCVNASCECEAGWGGSDCSMVVCPDNACGGIGECMAVNGTDYCSCPSSHSGAACEIENITPPAVTETVASTQYSSWDDYGDNHPLFNVSTVAQIRLSINPVLLESLLDPLNKNSDTYYPADFWFYNSNVQHFISKIGIRIKGNISRGMAKKSWKLNFNHFIDDDDNDWLQVGKLDLKGFQTDGSSLRDPLSLDIDYSMNGVTQRMGWAQVSINDVNFGHYLILESIDNNFLKSRFDTNDGALFKCQANLEWRGSNITHYQNDTGYWPKTNEAEDVTGWEALRDLTGVITLTPTESLPEELEPIFDVDLFIRTFVFEVATGNWDGLRDSNNFYLFQDPTDGLWKFIRHDMDASFGALPTLVGVGSNDIYEWAIEPVPGSGQLLYDRILSVDKYKLAYTLYMQELWNGFFDPQDFSVLWRRATAFQELNTIPVKQDYPGYFDCGYTYETYKVSWAETIQKPVTWYGQAQIIPGIKPWIMTRKVTAEYYMEQYFDSLIANGTTVLPSV